MTNNHYTTLFAEIPFPWVVVDQETWIILSANLKSSELMGYQTDQLIGQSIHKFIPDYKINPNKNVDFSQSPDGKKQPSLIDRGVFSMLHANHSQQSLAVKSYLLPQEEEPILAIFELDKVKKGLLDTLPPAEFWQALEIIATTANDQDLHLSITNIIRVSQTVTGAELITIYRIADDQPILKKWFSSDYAASPPEMINIQELGSLGAAQLWKPGRRTQNSLQRFARQEKFNYLATVPLGEKNAIIGLIVFAGNSPPVSNLRNFIQYISVTITSNLERYTWRKNIENELSSFQGRINSANIIEARISDGLILLTKTLEIKRINSAAETVLGYKHQEVTGQHISNILIGTDLVNKALRDAQNSSSAFRLGDNIRLYRRNGEPFQAIIRIFPIIQRQQVEEILILIQDLSEQEFIKKQTQQLEQRAFLGEVTATFAHEIRNPVHNISIGLQLMARNLQQDDPKQQDIDLMIQDCDRIAELIKSVLAFSKPIEYEMENVNIGQMFEHLLARLHSRIKRANVESSLQISPDCPTVIGNMHALEQVINNLVSNALQAMQPDGGRLVIKAHPIHTPEGRQLVEISIADTGRGIPKENQERIFQPFFTTEEKGTGLGLAVSKRILTAHKGTIRLTSFPGGTIFHIQLPASKGQ